MQRRFNYTGRRRIRRADVRITLWVSGGVRSFDCDLHRLSGMGLPTTAPVFVEAYYQTSFMRFPFGTVGALRRPSDTFLSDLAGSEQVHFRVRVVDPAEPGLLLAKADKISPTELEEGDENRICLLPIRTAKLGQLTWRLVFGEAKPILEMNDELPDPKSRAESDRQFHALVYPAVLREVLTHIVLFEEYEAPEQESDEWWSQWLIFARSLGAGDPPAANESSEEKARWIEAAVESFCRKYAFFDKFRKSLPEV